MTFCPYSARLPQFLDGQFSEEEHHEIELHVETCSLCGEELERLTMADGADLPLPPVSLNDVPLPDAGPAEELPAVPGYQILRVLGKGGQKSIVYLAEDGLRRRMALKMILPGSGAGPRDLARFRIQAEALARLQHPNIIPIYEVGTYLGRPFLAMEYVEGGSLKDRLEEGLPQPRDAAQLAKTLARAMHHAHQHAVLHRDLTPANVLLAIARCPLSVVSQEGGPPSLTTDNGQWTMTPKIIDFGLAKFLDTAAEQTCLTQSYEILGTPGYMAPEEAAGTIKQVGTLTDVYGLGAILYEILTGHVPFEGESILEIVNKTQYQAPTPPRRGRPEVPADLEAICLKCLEKEPARRYASAEQLADELGHFLRGEPLAHTRRVGRGERLWRWCRRNPALAAAQGIAALALLTLVAVALWFGIYSTVAAEKLTVALEDSRAANRKGAAVALGNASTLCESGRAPEGLLWMAHSLELASRAEAPLLEQTVRRQLAFHLHHCCPLQAIYEHGEKVSAIAMSPDGQVLLIGGAGGTARLWRVSTGETVGALLKHRDPVNAVAFSPDGKLVATGSGEPAFGLPTREPVVRLWDVCTGKLLHTLQHEKAVLTVAFSPDGKTVLTGGWGNRARLWDLATGKETDTPFLHPARVVAAAFSSDGKTLATAFVEKTGHEETQKVRLWEVATRRLLSESSRRADRTLALALRPDGKALWAARGSEGVQVWQIDRRGEEQVGPRWNRQDNVQTAAFNSADGVILTGAHDGYARLWDLATGRPLGAPVVNPGAVTTAAFGSRGETFLTGCDAASVRLWKRAPGEPATVPLSPPHVTTFTVTYGRDGKTLLTASLAAITQPGNRATSTLQRWDARTRVAVGPSVVVAGMSYAVVFHPRRNTVLIGGCEANLPPPRTWAQEWDLDTGKPAGPPLTDGEGVIISAAWSPEGGELVTGDTRGKVLLREAATGRVLDAPPRHKDKVTGVAFSPDGRMLLTGSRDQMARLWEPGTGRLLVLLHGDPVHAVAFHPDGRTVLTGSGDTRSKRGAARRWDPQTGNPLGPPLTHRDAVLAVAYSPDGTTILTGSADTTARLWDAATGQSLGPPLSHSAAVRAVAFHPQGTSLVTVSGDQHVDIWPTPGPLSQGADQVRLWVETLTGMELIPEGGLRASALGQEAWQQRRQAFRDRSGWLPP
jgi:WD40 repeat protein